MKRVFSLLIAIFFVGSTYAQEVKPHWAILEKGTSVGIVKPGINDLVYYISAGGKELNKQTIAQINERLKFMPGYPVLVWGEINGMQMATDVEGRTLLLKGENTKATAKKGASPAYVRTTLTTKSGRQITAGNYIWVQEWDGGELTTVQLNDGETLNVPIAALFLVDESTRDIMGDIVFKDVAE